MRLLPNQAFPTVNNPAELESRARYLLNVSVVVKDTKKYDEMRRQAQALALLADAARLKERAVEEKQG